jgi:putative glutamine amidotransferase
MHKPLIAVTSDVRPFDNDTWHATPQRYLRAAVGQAGVCPLIVPSFGEAIDRDAVLDAVDGLLVTGSKSNVHPERYGAEATGSHEPFDTERDATSLPLIRRAIERGIPLFAICRGLQELNVALGGTLAIEIQELDGRMDHRAPVSADQAQRFAIRHRIRAAPGSCLEAILKTSEIQVNSLHRQAIENPAPCLAVEAVADDGTIEAVSVADASGFTLGVQWHPEYWAGSDSNSRRLFEAFGDAVRAHAARRRRMLAAE